MHPGLYETYTIKEMITVVAAYIRSLLVLLEETGKDMKLKKKELSISEGYEVQIAFFLKILDQFARARKTPWSQFEQAQDLAKDTFWRTT